MSNIPKTSKELEVKLKIKNYQLLNIRHLTQELYLMKDIQQLFDVIEFTCIGFFQFKPVILFFDSNNKVFYSSKKKKTEVRNIIFNEKLINYYKTNNKINYLDDLINIDKTNYNVYSFMKKMNIMHTYPVIFKNRLKAIFFFGNKMSKASISDSDIELLSITGQVAVAAKENILLVQSLLNKNVELNESLENQKKLYNKLQEVYEELKSMDKLKDSFITLITHELNTPLTIIKSYIEALNSGVVEPTETNTIKEFYNAIEDNANILVKIVKSIVTLMKLQNNQVSFMYSNYNLPDLINLCIKDFENKIEKKNLDINISIDSIKKIKCDQAYIKQVFSIIFDNAIKYSTPNSKIDIFYKLENDGILLSVRDYGKGIPDDMKEHIFDRFALTESIMHHSQGIGISLAIAKMIIEKGHNGRLFVQSEEGKGSTFNIFLPNGIDT